MGRRTLRRGRKSAPTVGTCFEWFRLFSKNVTAENMCACDICATNDLGPKQTNAEGCTCSMHATVSMPSSTCAVGKKCQGAMMFETGVLRCNIRILTRNKIYVSHDHMLAVEKGSIVTRDNKELTSVRVRPCLIHFTQISNQTPATYLHVLFW